MTSCDVVVAIMRIVEVILYSSYPVRIGIRVRPPADNTTFSLGCIFTFGINTTSCDVVVPMMRIVDVIPYRRVILSVRTRLSVRPTADNTTTLYRHIPMY